MEQYSDENTVTIKLMIQNREYIVVSVYLPPGDDIEDSLALLKYKFSNIREENILIAGDFNAKNNMWYSKNNDVRGMKVLEFIEESRLNIMNKGGCLYTYDFIHSTENIDLTLVSNEIARISTNWVVEESISDHNLISWIWTLAPDEIIYKGRLHNGIKKWEKVEEDIKIWIRQKG